MPAKDVAREDAFAAIDAARTDIVRVAREIHGDPEPAGEEHRAAERLAVALEGHGYSVERGVAGMPTAFMAVFKHHDSEAMRKGLRHGHVGLVAEYDAMPGVGHTTGNNLSAGGVLATAIGLAAALKTEFGTVTVFGCPGPDERGGKVAMAKQSLFDEADVVLGMRPGQPGEAYPHTISRTGDTVATREASVRFTADDGGAAAEQFIEAIRTEWQSANSDDWVEINSEPGGAVTLAMQGETSVRLREISQRVSAVAAEAAGDPASVNVEFSDATDDMIVSRVLARRVKTYADTLGHRIDRIRQTDRSGPTGWGSISYASPSTVVPFPFTDEDVRRGEPAFAAAANTDGAYEQMLNFARCLCFVAIDVLRDMQFRAIADDQLVKELASRGISRSHRRWLGVHPVIPKPDENGKKRGPKMSDFKLVRGPGLPD